jgi:general secretion pathway protein C
MAAAPDAPTPPPDSAFGRLVTAALAVALAAVLAHWTWVFVTPPAATVNAPATTAGPDLALAGRLFGGSDTASMPASSGGLRLKGVIAPSPGDTASAVFSVGGKDRPVLLGAEVEPGVKLVEVAPDHAIVSRAGARERIDLDTRMAAIPRSVAGRPTGFKLPVSRTGPTAFSFSRKDLESALKDPGQLNHLGRIGVPPGGGVRLDDAPPGSLAARLGLQPGDVIRKVNGQSVASAGDLARLHQQFATTSLIQAEVQRGSGTVQINYTINP